MKALIGIVATVFAFNISPTFAKPPTINLKCGKLPNYKIESERQYLSKASGGGDIYTINVTFISNKPHNKKIDRILRECLDEAIKLDATKDITATPWIRPKAGSNPNDDDMLNIYGSMKYIAYKALDKTVSVHAISLQKK